VFCLSAVCETPKKFGIYLTLQAIGAEVPQTGLAQIAIEETPVIAGEDVQFLDLTNRVIKLRPDAIQRVWNRLGSAPVITMNGRKFMVLVGGERIFLGTFITDLTSFCPEMPTIFVDTIGSTNFFRFSSPRRGLAPWSDSRIKTALALDKRPREAE
jgi:hypothetical protein